ncbi:MAG TPA: ABC transporter permease [Motilibacteraceae bacterium]|nr:ABC transporter permease [Motilibacteraceae bacterium]
MGPYLLRRLGAAVITVVIASVVVFAGVHALPGDAALALAGEERSPQVLAQIRHEYGFDQPLPIQYVKYMGQALQGNLGQSTRIGAQVSHVLLERLPITLELSVLALLVGIVIGIPAGIASALRRGKAVDYGANGFALVGLSVPHFWLGLLLILAFSVNLHWLPASGYVSPFTDLGGNLQRMLLPALVLGTGLSAVLMRQMRSAMLESLSADYVRTARSKGLSEWRVVGIHALRNSLITVVTVLGLQLGALISGAVITEQIFVIPGFGKLVVDAIFQRDYPIIEGVTLVTVVGYVLVNLVVDLTYSFLNPRIRVSGASS